MQPYPATNPIVRLDASVETLIEALPSIGEIYLQARNRGGGLGKRLPFLEPILVDDLEFAFDADNGIGFSADSLVAVHAGSIEAGQESVPALDFEFESFPAGMSLHEFPNMSAPGSIGRFSDLFGGRSLGAENLLDWRNLIEPEFGMCECCAERSEKRAREACEHPLYDILNDAIEQGMRLECRLFSDHVDATSSFVPHQISARDGFLATMDAACENALHIDMRYVHALAINHETIDGVEYATLRIFDMRGEMNFLIMSEEMSSMSVWRWLCEARKV